VKIQVVAYRNKEFYEEYTVLQFLIKLVYMSDRMAQNLRLEFLLPYIVPLYWKSLSNTKKMEVVRQVSSLANYYYYTHKIKVI